jgi:hypothetical protein
VAITSAAGRFSFLRTAPVFPGAELVLVALYGELIAILRLVAFNSYFIIELEVAAAFLHFDHLLIE